MSPASYRAAPPRVACSKLREDDAGPKSCGEIVHHVPAPSTIPGKRPTHRLVGRDQNAPVEQPQPDRRVLTTLARFWRGRDIGIVYGAIVIVVSLWIGLHSDATVRKLVENVSTNLDNMRASPLAVLAASAFVVSPLTQLLLVPVVVFVFGLVQRWLGRTALRGRLGVRSRRRHPVRDGDGDQRPLPAHRPLLASWSSPTSASATAWPPRSVCCARGSPRSGDCRTRLGCLGVTVGDVRDLAGLHLARAPDRDRHRSRHGGGGARRRGGGPGDGDLGGVVKELARRRAASEQSQWCRTGRA